MSARLAPPAATRDGQLEFSLQVSGTTLRHALSFVGASGGLLERATVTEQTVVVCDSLRAATSPDTHRRRVLVVEPTPLAAQRSLRAITTGRAMAVFFADEPDDLLASVHAVAADRATVPRRVIDLAAAMPELTERQLAVLVGIASGRRNHEIARSLHLSAASVKRELAELFRSLGAQNRIEASVVCLQLGIRPGVYA